jgi:hypothetical protein
MDRRNFLLAGAVSSTVSLSGWMGRLAAAEAVKKSPKRTKSVILLWLNGGPSTIDLWDCKPGHDNGGPTTEIKTAAEGLRVSHLLPSLAKCGKDLAILRGMSTKEGDHGRATHLMRTGQLPFGALQYPTLGSLVSKELGDATAEIPNFISIAPQRFFNLDAFGPGFLGPKYAPLVIGENQGFNGRAEADFKTIDAGLKVDNLARADGISAGRAADRMEALARMQEQFAAAHPGPVPAGHASAYDRSARLMQSDAAKTFDLSGEKAKERERYGKTFFGQGCLLARRLVERGVPFVEVNHGFWDTHNQNFDQIKPLAGTLDQGFSALLTDLRQRGLLNSTLVVCMGEFGRTPKINGQNGRDHYPNAWSAVLAGGGTRGGQAVGKTSKDGTTVEERPVSPIDLLATVCKVIGVDADKQNMSNIGRPIRIVDRAAKPVTEVLA